jgi:hypothetical protein
MFFDPDLVPVYKLSVFHVFELESSNSRRVKNLNRSPEVAFVRFFEQKTNKKHNQDEDLDFEQQRRGWTL